MLFDSKTSELNKIIKNLSEEFGLRENNGKIQNKDFSDELFSISLASKSVVKNKANNKPTFSFSQTSIIDPHENTFEPINDAHETDEINQEDAFDLIRKGSGAFPFQKFDQTKENECKKTNQTSRELLAAKLTLKRNSNLSFGKNSFESEEKLKKRFSMRKDEDLNSETKRSDPVV